MLENIGALNYHKTNMKNIAIPKINEPYGGVGFKTFCSVMGKFCHADIVIPAAKGLFISVTSVLGRELSWVNLAKSIAVRQLADGVQQLLQEAAAEPTKCTELMLGVPA